MKIFIDTNFFLALQFLDIFKELKKYSNNLATFDSCIKELEKISKSKKKEASYANIALALIKKKEVKIIKTEKSADSALLSYAKRYKCYVATNDRKLIKALKNNGIKAIRLRQKKYLILE